MQIKETLITKLKDKSAQIAILGLGYVGLPLAVVFAEAGFRVTGIDPDKRKIEALRVVVEKQMEAAPKQSDEPRQLDLF